MSFYQTIRMLMDAGTKDKVRNLALLKDDQAHKEIFRLMLCPTINYYIKKPSVHHLDMSPPVIFTDGTLVANVLRLLDLNLRGDALKHYVNKIYQMCDTERAAVLEWILDGQNPAKIGRSIVDKIWPGLIYNQVYMGAVPGDDKALERLNWIKGINVQKKEDGLSLLFKYTAGIPVSIHTRAGQDITKYFPGLLARQKFLPPEFNYIVHHEGLVWDTEDEVYLDRQVGNGLINKHVKNGKIGGGVDKSIHTILLDYYGTEPQAERYFYLSKLENETTRRVEQQLVFSEAEAREIALGYISKGDEGAICKDPRMPFKNGKPWYCVKMKNEFTVDLRAVDWKEHTKRPGEVGSILCQSEDGILEVWVNARTDADRMLDFDSYWKGVIFQVKAESIIKSKTKKKPSLYLPRFDGGSYYEYIRDDKAVADTYLEIKLKEKESKEMNHDSI